MPLGMLVVAVVVAACCAALAKSAWPRCFLIHPSWHLKVCTAMLLSGSSLTYCAGAVGSLKGDPLRGTITNLASARLVLQCCQQCMTVMLLHISHWEGSDHAWQCRATQVAVSYCVVLYCSSSCWYQKHCVCFVHMLYRSSPWHSASAGSYVL